ncbi:TPA: hypothetical protein ACKRS0_003511 [Proteus mirabilis]
MRHLLDNSLSAKVNCWDMGGNGCDLLCSYDLTSGTYSHLP